MPLFLLAMVLGQIERFPKSGGLLIRLPKHQEGTQDPSTIAKRKRRAYLWPLAEKPIRNRSALFLGVDHDCA